MTTLSNTARTLLVSLVLVIGLTTAYSAGFVGQMYSSYILPNSTFQTAVLPLVPPACDLQVMALDLGIPMENIAKANSSGTANGAQIWLRESQQIKVTMAFEAVHNYGDTYAPGETTPITNAFTAYRTEPC